MDSNRSESGTLKRSFSDMEEKETAESDNCAFLPTPVHEGYFIAVRQKREINLATSKVRADPTHIAVRQKREINLATSKVRADPTHTNYQSCCVFGCWEDARAYLEQTEREGRSVEADAFDNIDDATRYAFGMRERTSTPGSRFHATNMGIYRKKKLQLQVSHRTDTDTPLTALEQLPQDVLTNIYRYLCPGSGSSCSIFENMRSIGMTSKNMYQTCMEYVKHEPLCLYEKHREDSVKTLSFFLKNEAKVDTFNIHEHVSPISACISLLILKFSDLSMLKSLDLAYDYDGYDNDLKDKWELVESGLASFDLVGKCEKTIETSIDNFYRECSELIAASGAPSLKVITMILAQDSFEIYNELLLCAIDRLEELYFEIENDIIVDGGDRTIIKRIEQLVHKAPKLKRLEIYGSACCNELKIWSKSLEFLELIIAGFYETELHIPEIHCPALTTLHILIMLHGFDPNIFVKRISIQLIKKMRLTIDANLDGDYIAGWEKVSEMLGQMPSLKELDLEVKKEGAINIVNLPPKLERLWINCDFLAHFSHSGASLKMLHFRIKRLFDFEQFKCNLENVVDLTIVTCDELEGIDTIVSSVCKAIEVRMPKLKRFKLVMTNDRQDNFGGIITLKSESLEELEISEDLEDYLNVICPNLKTRTLVKGKGHATFALV